MSRKPGRIIRSVEFGSRRLARGVFGFSRSRGIYDEENDKRLGFFTNNFELPALTIAQLNKCRWQVELFFKWIKQHLRIKAFFGTNENAVKRKSGSPSAFTYSSPSSKNVSDVAASLLHNPDEFSASRFSRKYV